MKRLPILWFLLAACAELLAGAPAHAANPMITSVTSSAYPAVSITSAVAGTMVQVNGSGFEATQGPNFIGFCNAMATTCYTSGDGSITLVPPGPGMSAWSNTQITLYVPAAASVPYGPYSIYVFLWDGNKTDPVSAKSNGFSFTSLVPGPFISNLTGAVSGGPAGYTALPGAEINIYGSGFADFQGCGPSGTVVLEQGQQATTSLNYRFASQQGSPGSGVEELAFGLSSSTAPGTYSFYLVDGSKHQSNAVALTIGNVVGNPTTPIENGPQISVISPNPAWLQPTEQIAISGSGFGATMGKGAVTLSSTSGAGAPVVLTQNVAWSNNEINFEPPPSLPVGTYQVSVTGDPTAACGKTSSSATLTIVAQRPPIINFISPNPAWLQPTVQISIFGSGFDATMGNGAVKLAGASGASAPVVLTQNVTWSANQITFEPPSSLPVGTYQVSVTGDSTAIGGQTSNSVALTIWAQQPLVKTSVLTQRYNSQRTGANNLEPVLNVQNVAGSSFQKLHEIDLDGQVYAQPLLVSNVLFSNGTAGDILLVATMNNTLSAFLVDNGLPGSTSFAPVPLWSQNFGTPVPGNFMPMAGTADTCVIPNLCLPNGNHDTPDAPAALPPIGQCCKQNFANFNVNPSFGITSTPVILVGQDDSGTFVIGGAVYGVAAVMGSGGTVAHHLFSVDLRTGKVINNIVISGSVPATSPDSANGLLALDANQQMQRPALLADPRRHELFVAFGSHQDTRPWHGWVFKFFADALGDLQNLPGAASPSIWTSTPGALGGAIWQSGSGLAEDDSNGTVYAMTGNGENNTEGDSSTDQSFNAAGNNFASMFVALDPTLQPFGVSGFFAPPDETLRESQDLDLGSSGPVKMPGMNILIGGDKEGLIFVLDTGSKPKLGMRQIFQASKPHDSFNLEGAGNHHIHGTPTIWRNSSGVLTLYVWPERDNLRAFSWDDQNAVFDCPNSSGQLAQCPAAVLDCHDLFGQPIQCPGGSTNAVAMSSIEAPDCSFGTLGCSKMPGGIISVSSNGSSAGSGIVWAAMPIDTDALYRVVPGVLRAFNAEDLNTELWDSSMNSGRDGGFNFAKFVPPVVANGRVYMATFGNSANVPGSINIYGLSQAPN